MNKYKMFLKALNIVENLLMLTSSRKKELEEKCINECMTRNNFTITEMVSFLLFSYISDIDTKFLTKPTIEGESKKVHVIPNTEICLISLKPTLYSYTHNRYNVAEGTDEKRDNLWGLFCNEVNECSADFVFNGTVKYSSKVFDFLEVLKETGKLTEDYPFLTSYLGEIEIDDTRYAICRYMDNGCSPLELVWKDYLVGTMTHNLLTVDKFKTKTGDIIKTGDKLPNEIVRFDWRNPFQDENGNRAKDEAIPEDFAQFYTDTKTAKITALTVCNIIKEFMAVKDYIFVDTCFFINRNGNVLFSEITPDGMRIKKKIQNETESFDKDLWREGKDVDVINHQWQELYEDLISAKRYGVE